MVGRKNAIAAPYGSAAAARWWLGQAPEATAFGRRQEFKLTPRGQDKPGTPPYNGIRMPILPPLPALAAGHGRAVLLGTDGTIAPIKPGTVAKQLGGIAALVVHGPATLQRLGNPAVDVLDLLELFAFVCPAQSLAPTPAGLARALEVPVPASLEEAAASLAKMAEILLARLEAGRETPLNRDAAGLAARMGGQGWGW